MNIDLTGKIALVTGGSGELGRVIVRTLSECGAKVIVCYHNGAERAEKLVNELEGSGGTGFAIRADVTDENSVNNMRDQVSACFGVPDILVNNAVIQYEWKSVLQQPVEDYLGQFESCVLQNVLMAKAFVPQMMEKRWGRIIGINTECSMQNFENQSAYTAGKRGMDGVMKVLAKEIGEHQITVNQVAPGWIISERERREGMDNSSAYIASVPLRRRGSDQEIANVVAFLASDLASFITGAYIPVCGGNVMPSI